MHISMERVHVISCAKLLHFVFYSANPSVALNQAPSHCQRCTVIHLTHKHKRLSHTHTHTQLNGILQVCYCGNFIHGRTDCRAAHRPVWHRRLIDRLIKIEWRRRVSIRAAETCAWVMQGCTESEG